MEKPTLEDIKKLYLRFQIIYGTRFTKDHSTENHVKIWWSDWFDGLKDTNLLTIKEAIDYCKLNIDWPPTLAEFIRLCEKYSGFPDEYQILDAMIRRDFSHPVVKIFFDKIGSWQLRGQDNTQDDVMRKIKNLYPEVIADYRVNFAKKLLAWHHLVV